MAIRHIRRKSNIIACVGTLLGLLIGKHSATAQSISNVIRLGGAKPIAVAVDPTTNRTYVANRDNATVSVVEGVTRQILKTIPLVKQPTAIAVNPQTNTIYVTDNDNAVAVIDGASNQMTAVIPVGGSPTDIAVNPNTNFVYTTNSLDATVSVIDGSVNAVIATVPVGVHPTSVAVDTTTQRVYVANYGGGSLSVLGGVANTVVETIPSTSIPFRLAINSATHKLYIVNYGFNFATHAPFSSVDVFDTTTGTFTNLIPFEGVSFDVAVNSVTNKIYVTDYTSAISVIDGETLARSTNALDETNLPDAIAVNETTGKVYATNYSTFSSLDPISQNTILELDGALQLTGKVSLGKVGGSIATNPVTNRAYLGYGQRELLVLNTETEEIVTTIDLGAIPAFVAVNPITNKIYAATFTNENRNDGLLVIIDGTTNVILNSLPINTPMGVGIDTVANRIYIGEQDVEGITVSQIAVLDGITDTLVGSIPVGIYSFGIDVNSQDGKIYVVGVNFADHDVQLLTIDGRAGSIVNRVSLPTFYGNVALNTATNRFYLPSPVSLNLDVLNGTTNAFVSTIDVTTVGLAINPVINRIYTTSYDGTVSVIDGVNDTVRVTLPAGSVPTYVAANTATGRAYVVGTETYTVSVVSEDPQITPALTLRPHTGTQGDLVGLTAQLRSTTNNAPVANKMVAFKVMGTIVGMGMTNASGQASIHFQIPNTMSTGNKTLTAEFGGDGAARAVSAASTLNVVRAVSLSGKVTLENVVNAEQAVTFTFRPTNGTEGFSRSVVLNSNGTYSLPNLPAQQYTVRVKGAKWLAQTLTVNASTGNVTTGDFSLSAGDANDDNRVDIRDLLLLIVSYNTASGEGDFNESADFDCDSVVDIEDLFLLIGNYNTTGSP